MLIHFKSCSLFSALLRYYWHITYVSLRCAVWWFDAHIYWEMIAMIKLLTPEFPHIIIFFVCVVIRIKIYYSLHNFPVYNTVLLIRTTILYIRSPQLIHLIAESLCPLTSISPFPTFPSPWQPLFLLSISLTF